MDRDMFAGLEQVLADSGPAAAVGALCRELQQGKDYANLFYALLLKKRCELGVSPVPTEPAHLLPAAAHAPYEEAIRAAAREVGQAYLAEGDVLRAWVYFRMIGEPGPVAAVLENYELKDDEQSQQIIELAFYQGVNPRKGFDWLLERYGICNAITTVSGFDFSNAPDARDHCIRRLVRALQAELLERLRADIARREGDLPPGDSVPALLAGRDWLFEEEFSHVDVSHLSSVVQMCLNLTPGPELALARELCAYGERLSPRLRCAGDPPFDDSYRDYGIYLATVAGELVEEGLAHFRRKVDNADPENEGTLSAEVLVNLLVRLGRPAEALALARRHLVGTRDRPLSCPGIVELCQMANDYRSLAAAAREQGDPVHFLAGLLASKQPP